MSPKNQTQTATQKLLKQEITVRSWLIVTTALALAKKDIRPFNTLMTLGVEQLLKTVSDTYGDELCERCAQILGIDEGKLPEWIAKKTGLRQEDVRESLGLSDHNNHFKPSP